MKTKFYLILALAISAFAFTGCSDDDDDSITTAIAGNYSVENTNATNGGIKAEMAKVSIKAKGNNYATLTLTNIVNGHADFDMDALFVSTTTSDYSFLGTKEVDGMIVAAEGTIKGGKINIQVTTKHESDLIGTWEYNVTDESLDAIEINYENKSGKVIWGGEAEAETRPEVSCEEFEASIKTWIELILSMTVNPLEITFDENGYVSIKATMGSVLGKKEGASEEEPNVIVLENIARYYYNPTSKVLTFDAVIDAEDSPIKGLIQFPFNCELAEGKLRATLPYEFLKTYLPMLKQLITQEQLQEMLNQLDKLVPPGLSFFLPTIKMMIADLYTIVTADDIVDLSITGKLQKVTETETEPEQ